MKRYRIYPTKGYRKDYKRIVKSGFDIEKLEKVIDMLASGNPLPEQHRDHPLKGSIKGARECHIGPDWLLMYTKDNNALVLLLLRTGTHRDVLGIE